MFVFCLVFFNDLTDRERKRHFVHMTRSTRRTKRRVEHPACTLEEGVVRSPPASILPERAAGEEGVGGVTGGSVQLQQPVGLMTPFASFFTHGVVSGRAGRREHVC